MSQIDVLDKGIPGRGSIVSRSLFQSNCASVRTDFV